MRVLLVHNFYQQPGGEDQVFVREADLLERRGHEVIRFSVHNDDVPDRGRLALAAGTIWNRGSARALSSLLAARRPDVMHVHNTLPLVSPAAYYAARSAGVPVVQTLHNFRLLCPSGLLFRDGAVCESCVGRRTAWPGVAHGCYRNSRAATAAVAVMLSVHGRLNTWRDAVDAYIALTEFSRGKFIDGGLPAERVVVKPNFVEDTGVGPGDGGYALFVGRLSPEKGILTMIEAWRRHRPSLKLRIVGDGPLAGAVRAAADLDPGIEWCGRRTPDEVAALMRRAALLLFPSEWYETFGLTIVEAFAAGTPVLSSRFGTMESLVEEGRTGGFFTAGDPADLARSLAALSGRPGGLAGYRHAARATYLETYTPEANERRLRSIYDRVIEAAAGDGRRRA